MDQFSIYKVASFITDVDAQNINTIRFTSNSFWNSKFGVIIYSYPNMCDSHAILISKLITVQKQISKFRSFPIVMIIVDDSKERAIYNDTTVKYGTRFPHILIDKTNGIDMSDLELVNSWEPTNPKFFTSILQYHKTLYEGKSVKIITRYDNIDITNNISDLTKIITDCENTNEQLLKTHLNLNISISKFWPYYSNKHFKHLNLIELWMYSQFNDVENHRLLIKDYNQYLEFFVDITRSHQFIIYLIHKYVFRNTQSIDINYTNSEFLAKLVGDLICDDYFNKINEENRGLLILIPYLYKTRKNFFEKEIVDDFLDPVIYSPDINDIEFDGASIIPFIMHELGFNTCEFPNDKLKKHVYDNIPDLLSLPLNELLFKFWV